MNKTSDQISSTVVVDHKNQLDSKVQIDRIEKGADVKLKKTKVKLSDDDIGRLISELKTSLVKEATSQFHIGDIVIELRKGGGGTYDSIGKQVGRDGSTLCTYAKVAAAYDETHRDYTRDFSWYSAIYAAEKVTCKQLLEKAGLPIEPNYLRAMQKCAANPGAATARKASKFLVDQANAMLPTAKPSAILSQCIHMKVEEYFRTCPPLSARIIHADFPFGAFWKTEKGVCDPSTSKAQLTECDHATRKEAIETTCAFFQALGERLDEHLAPGGVILGWQNEELRWEIGKAIEDAGLRVGRMIPWAKNGCGKPGNYGYPWMNSLETLYVVQREGDTVTFGENGKPYSTPSSSSSPFARASTTLKSSTISRSPRRHLNS